MNLNINNILQKNTKKNVQEIYMTNFNVPNKNFLILCKLQNKQIKNKSIIVSLNLTIKLKSKN